MTMAEVRIDMETSLYEQMAALCAKNLAPLLRRWRYGSAKSSCGWERLPCLSPMHL